MSEEKTKMYLGDVLISGEDINIDATPTAGSSNAVSSGGTYTAIQNAIEKSIAIYDVEDDGSTTAGTWLGKSNEITSLYDGLTIRYKVTVAGASTTKLNVNGLGEKIVYRSGSTKLTTNYAVGSYIFLYYSSLNSGCWEVYSDYDANSYAYVRQYQAGDNAAGTAPKYPLLARYNVSNKNASYDTAYSRYHTGATLDTSTGELEATSFIKSGGTSSQFLKADGSVDSNTYATTSALGNYLPLAGGQMNQGSVIKWTDYSQLSSSKLQIPGAILEYGSLRLIESSEGKSGGLTLDDSNLYAKHGSKTFTFPNTSGTLALTSAIPTVDSTPTASSTNAVSSGGVYTAIDNAQVWEPGTGTNSAVLKGLESTAAGNYSTVEGYKSETGGTYTSNDISISGHDGTNGSYSHAEGLATIASGPRGAHAEGAKNLASGAAAHVEGGWNKATAQFSHAEGYLTTASNESAHAEGNATVASGLRSHAEGRDTIASGQDTHSEGRGTVASGHVAHAEGAYTKATNDASHSEGYYSEAAGDVSHAEGKWSFASGLRSHAEGMSISKGRDSHSESGNKGMEVWPVGGANATSYTTTFDEEWRSVRTAVGDTVFCNILKSSYIILKSANDGAFTKITSASYSGDTLTFTTESTLSETALDGSAEYWINMSVAYGERSHSENMGNTSYGEGSHAEGEYTVAIGGHSHSEGIGTITNNEGEHAEGRYNKSTKTSATYSNAGNTQHSIGIGTSSARKNAVEVMQNGDMYVIGVGNYDGTNFTNADTLQESIPSVDTVPTSGSSNAVSSGGVYTELLDVVHQGDLIGSATYEDSGTVVDLTDYVREDNLKTINNQSLIGSGNITISGGSGGGGEANVIEAITFNGASVPVTNKTAAITATIPAAVTESTVSGWGFTKNTGTYSKPSGGIPKTDLASAVQTSLGKADTALQSYTETDPTVPAWAKASTKPTYTASEVGALPSTTTIPTKTSDLTNDSGFITDSGVVKTSGDQSISGIKTFSSEVRMTAGGTSDITSGILCSFKTNRAQITNFATHNIYTGGTNSTTPITFYKYGSVSSQAPASPVQLAKIDTDGNIYEGNTKLSDKYLTSYTETDPTVPAWAKAATKPTYTAAEVGALPNTTVIPATTSALTNDSGFKKITISSSEPTSSDGVNGDIWIVI